MNAFVVAAVGEQLPPRTHDGHGREDGHSRTELTRTLLFKLDNMEGMKQLEVHL